MKALSREQRRTLTTVGALTLLRGRSPTLAELAHCLGCSRASAHERLFYLEKKGLWSARAWAPTSKAFELVRASVDSALAETLPLLGKGPAKNQRRLPSGVIPVAG